MKLHHLLFAICLLLLFQTSCCYTFKGISIDPDVKTFFVQNFETETSNGIILVEVFELKKFECLGIEKEGFDVQVYDFLAHGITSNYDGVVGLDWFREHKICVDLKMGEIAVD